MAERRIIKGWIVERGPDGTMRPIGPATQQPAMPADPTFPLKGPTAVADLANKQASTERTVAQTQGDYLGNQNTSRTIRQNPISTDDAQQIAQMRATASGIPESLQMARNAGSVVDRFHPGPDRAAIMHSSVPSPDGGILDSLQSRVWRTLNGVSDQDINDYQELQRFSNQAVLQKQVEQKGPQTDSDAMRMMMAGISPDKGANVNARIVGDTTLFGLIAQKKPDFYSRWANRHGSVNALDEAGDSVDDAWAKRVAAVQSEYAADPRIKRLGSSGASNVIRYDQNGNRIK